MKTIYVIKVDYTSSNNELNGNQNIVSYCENEKLAKKAVKLLNGENKEFGDIYSYEEVQSIYNYMGLK